MAARGANQIMPDSAYRGRFAPSPTGPLHFGSLLAALGSWLFARQAGGAWLVRVEDLDPPREVPGSAAQQLATLDAFGLVPDEPVWRQSRRGDAYAAALARLEAAGLTFACRCSRADLSASGGLHRACTTHANDRHPAIRMRVEDGCRIAFVDGLRGALAQDLHHAVGDFVLRRADGPWAYQLAVVVDDAEQGITDIVRGADLLDSTPRQILLQRALGLPTPRYIHLPVVLDAQGLKLGKSSGALAIDPGDPLPALHLAWRALGQAGDCRGPGGPAAFLRRAVAGFEPRRVPTHDVRADTLSP